MTTTFLTTAQNYLTQALSAQETSPQNIYAVAHLTASQNAVLLATALALFVVGFFLAAPDATLRAYWRARSFFGKTSRRLRASRL